MGPLRAAPRHRDPALLELRARVLMFGQSEVVGSRSGPRDGGSRRSSRGDFGEVVPQVDGEFIVARDGDQDSSW